MAITRMVPEAVQEIVKRYADEVRQLQDCCEWFAKADSEIQIWRGPAAETLRENIKSKIPAFNELLEVVNSYGEVSREAANAQIEADNALMRELHNTMSA